MRRVKANRKAEGLDFLPFRAWRYNPRQVELSRVIAPPYDVISLREQEALYGRSPFNVVRLILGKENNFYEAARKRWEEWTQRGVLIRDGAPSYYLYEQTFKHPWDGRPMRRLAVIGILKLDRPDQVLPHEATFEGPKKDRFQLLAKTKVNFSPIFGLIRDSKGVMTGLASRYRQKPPLFEAAGDEGSFHRGWALEAGGEQDRFHQWVRKEKILIADGHHRYETAVAYRYEMRKKFPEAPDGQPYDFAMTALVGFEDEGLLMLPTHRMIRSLGVRSRTEFLSRLRDHFDLLPFPDERLFSELLHRPKNEIVLGGLFGSDGSFLLRFKNPKGLRRPPSFLKRITRYRIEADLLNRLVFDSLWGLAEAERRDLIEYTRSSEEAVEKIKKNQAEAAFLLRPPEIERVRALADRGERMPQKTTYFYPKLADGFVFYSHE